jgi:hypothetical protein
MASIRKERHISAAPEDVWAALRDWGVPHQRLVPGFVVAARLEGDDRIVTFFNGSTVREVLIALEEQERRLVWSVVDGPYTHHNGAAQVLPDGDGGSTFVWIADLLPDELAERTAGLMEQGIDTVKRTLEASVPSPAGSAEA